MHEHGAYLWRALRSLGVAEAELSDVCQEVFLVVHRQLPGFEGRSSLRTWIYGIALRVAADYRGKAYRRREVLPASLPEQVSEPEQGHALERRDAWTLIGTLLAQLDDERRQVFVLYEIEQLSMPQVATLLGWPLSTAYARLASARAQVQQALAALHTQNEGP